MEFIMLYLASVTTMFGIGMMTSAMASSSRDKPKRKEEISPPVQSEPPQDSGFKILFKNKPLFSTSRLSAAQEYELRMAESKRLDEVCKDAISTARERWVVEGRATTDQQYLKEIDDRYANMINNIIKNCKPN